MKITRGKAPRKQLASMAVQNSFAIATSGVKKQIVILTLFSSSNDSNRDSFLIHTCLPGFQHVGGMGWGFAVFLNVAG
jgi:hypothetical protein